MRLKAEMLMAEILPSRVRRMAAPLAAYARCLAYRVRTVSGL
jgi:hypothetical protein